jgi:NADPH:quinone reductase-like Zn-dependent oxidoreductase
VNYRRHPDWEDAVLEATNGRGVDVAVEVGGAGTLPRSIVSTRIAGTIALIGVLAGGQIDPAQFMRRSIRMQGIYVGSRRMFLDMNRAIEAHGLRPVIDSTFSFAEAREAYRHMEGAGHLGKIVIEM